MHAVAEFNCAGVFEFPLAIRREGVGSGGFDRTGADRRFAGISVWARDRVRSGADFDNFPHAGHDTRVGASLVVAAEGERGVAIIAELDVARPLETSHVLIPVVR